eukprot:4640648-Pyramimonas_sp.AAC.1
MSTPQSSSKSTTFLLPLHAATVHGVDPSPSLESTSIFARAPYPSASQVVGRPSLRPSPALWALLCR